jgi:hypothetical protein
MSKKLMLLVAGVLSALALTALPSVASAGEPTLHCTSLPCTYTVAGGVAELSTVGGNTVKCTSVTGNGTSTVLSGTTGTVTLTFHECREQVTGFGFSCTGKEQPTRTIKTNSMVTHNVLLAEKAKVANGTPGVLVTGANVTFTCAGFQSFTVTGNVLGHFENPQCNTPTKTYNLEFAVTAHGQQKFKLVTETGNPFDLETNNDTVNGKYETSAQKGTGTLTFNQNVTLTC